ncbi:hypothetical protein C0Q70_08751 [Pomacea canaliculata]|uniref:Uncharacterized protein n=1 Tax=Pomacea canaliculata TaxID=400727 RepID=A0A2T7P7V0_POMCA|nr:hypothetical protein C0Q70_08751 [Pomacea canaliculata]
MFYCPSRACLACLQRLLVIDDLYTRLDDDDDDGRAWRLLLLSTCAILLLEVKAEGGGAVRDVEGCRKTSSCTCQTDDGSEVDLSPLAFNNGTPRYLDIADDTGLYLYSWNPCTAFSEGDCQGVAVCQKISSSQLYYSLGQQSTADFQITSSRGFMIKYTGEGTPYVANRWSIMRISKYHLEEVILGRIVLAELHHVTNVATARSPSQYFTLRSRYACPKGGPITTATPFTFPPPLTGATKGPDSFEIVIDLLFCILVTAVVGVVVLLMVLTALLVRRSRKTGRGSRDKVVAGRCPLLVHHDFPEAEERPPVLHHQLEMQPPHPPANAISHNSSLFKQTEECALL